MVRFITSFNFLLLVGLFFLPWLDIRCEGGGKSVGILKQSGYEAASGEFSEGELFQELKKGEAKQGKAKPKNENADDNPFAKDKKGAPLLYAYVGLLAIGTIVSLVLPRGKTWRGGVAICAIAVICILGVQTAIGFPIEQKARDVDEARNKELKPPGNDAAAKLADAMAPRIVTKFHFAFYLSWLFGFTCLGCILMDSLLTAKTRGKRPVRPVDDDDGGDNPFK